MLLIKTCYACKPTVLELAEKGVVLLEFTDCANSDWACVMFMLPAVPTLTQVPYTHTQVKT